MPWLRRSSPHFVPFLTLQYSTRAAAFWGVPAPKLSPIRGRAPTIAPSEEFIGANLVGFDRVPSFCRGCAEDLSWPDTIEPVVAGEEIPSGISNDWNPEVP